MYHVESFKAQDYSTGFGKYLFARMAGREGVRLFFVLSGFLLTYLLLLEQRSTERIDIKRFYARRALRIWPLYYLIVGLSFFVLPHLIHYGTYSETLKPDFAARLGLYVALLPNFELYYYPAVLFASQAWSIGVEEQFYLIWPWFLRLFSRKPLVPLVGILLAKLFANWAAARYLAHWRVLNAFLDDFEIEAMAIGGIASLAMFTPSTTRQWTQFPGVRLGTVALLGLAFHFKLSLPQSRLFIEMLCGCLILQTASAKRRNTFLDNPAVQYLGRISYGLYMFHSIAIVLALLFVKWLAVRETPGTVLIYSTSTALTVFFAALSYELIEKKFIRLKPSR